MNNFVEIGKYAEYARGVLDEMNQLYIDESRELTYDHEHYNDLGDNYFDEDWEEKRKQFEEKIKSLEKQYEYFMDKINELSKDIKDKK